MSRCPLRRITARDIFSPRLWPRGRASFTAPQQTTTRGRLWFAVGRWGRRSGKSQRQRSEELAVFEFALILDAAVGRTERDQGHGRERTIDADSCFAAVDRSDAGSAWPIRGEDRSFTKSVEL